MVKREKQKNRIFLISALSVAVLDQLTKAAAKAYLAEPLSVIRDFFSLSYVKNTGAGFGILQGQNMMIAFLTLAFIGAVLYFYDKIPHEKKTVVFTGILLGGAVGNLIDRLVFGFVQDFIAFSFWPAFNVADMGITIGGIGLIVYLWNKDSKNKKK